MNERNINCNIRFLFCMNSLTRNYYCTHSTI